MKTWCIHGEDFLFLPMALVKTMYTYIIVLKKIIIIGNNKSKKTFFSVPPPKGLHRLHFRYALAGVDLMKTLTGLHSMTKSLHITNGGLS